MRHSTKYNGITGSSIFGSTTSPPSSLDLKVNKKKQNSKGEFMSRNFELQVRLNTGFGDKIGST